MSHKPSSRIPTATSSLVPAYVTWDGNLTENPEVIQHISGAVDEYRGVKMAQASTYSTYASYYGHHYDYSDLASNVSGRPGLTRYDYEAFRPQEALPTDIKEIMACSDGIYRRVGLIRNIIDLMGDFGSQGIRVTHPNKQIQKFYAKWFARVNGRERSERFLNNFYRLANVVVRVQTAKLSKKDGRRLEKIVAKPDLQLEKLGIYKGEIPIKYTFLPPMIVDTIGGQLASFVGKPQYMLTLPSFLRKIISSPKNDIQRKLVNMLPDEVKQAASTNNPVPLPQDKTRVFHYKKDDWQEWAYPMIYSIMTDINILEKMKLADTAALDGAISNVRVWKLGSLEHKIGATRVAAAKLAEVLESNVGGGTMDLIWGPDLELIESKSDVYKFLGEEKFKPHLDNIYTGLGIPPTLTGTFGNSGTTNNFISLKTLLQRLQYGRDALSAFWDLELQKVQFAMGFRFPAKIEYDIDNLGDENAEKALLVQLADRNLISDELLQYRFGHDPIMEKIRLNREYRERDNGSLLPKSGPYHDSQIGTKLKQVAMGSNLVTPGQIGLSKDAKQRDMRLFDPNPEDVKLDVLHNTTQMSDNAKPPGRPKNAKDKTKRKTKRFAPLVKAQLNIWLDGAHSKIAELLNPIYLQEVQKTNMRHLTGSEMSQIERIRFNILLSLQPLQDITLKDIANHFDNKYNDLWMNNAIKTYKQYINNISKSFGRSLTLVERQQIQSQLYISNLDME